jgi:hypothetical protein
MNRALTKSLNPLFPNKADIITLIIDTSSKALGRMKVKKTADPDSTPDRTTK